MSPHPQELEQEDDGLLWEPDVCRAPFVSKVALRALRDQWRQREQQLCRKADAQPSMQYAQRLAAEAEGIARCCDAIDALLTGAGRSRGDT